MRDLLAIHLPLLVWLAAFCLFGLFLLMYSWARKQKGAAMAFGIFVQMFLPDPKAQQTIEFVAESKQEEAEKGSSSKTIKDNEK
ncbi:hypothetical protein EYS14_00005 [Alteromonadaceae bacterium M269]|nr:hypothetical protein EYS14_00005 [Alteromonadaceae bacterium M269]